MTEYNKGIFTLSKYYDLELSDSWYSATPFANNYGYVGGGSFPTFIVSTITRIEYTNDSQILTRSTFSGTRSSLAAVGNSSYGYFGGGSGSVVGSNSTTVERIDYGNDTATASPKGPLSVGRERLSAVGNSSYGWFGGGYVSPAGRSTVDRIDYSNDTATASPRGPLTSTPFQTAATGNSSYGYFGGGRNPGPTSSYLSKIDRIDYDNDTVTALTRSSLTTTRPSLSATGNSFYGYFAGGQEAPAPSPVSRLERLDYVNDTLTVASRGPLLAAFGSGSSLSSVNNGYFNLNDTAQRLDFSNDLSSLTYTSSNPSNGINSAAVSAASNGLPRIYYPAVNNGITVPDQYTTATNYGYFGGNFDVTIFTSVDRIDYTNDTTTPRTRGPLAFSRILMGATGNSSYGYFAGGGPALTSPSPVRSYVERIDYANDTAVASRRGGLSIDRRSVASTGNTNYGWFGGGSTAPGTNQSVVDRIDYSDDTVTASPRGELSLARDDHAAAGNSNYGWFAGGTPGPQSLVDRIDYANDTAIASVRGPLNNGKDYLAATGNSNYGWFGGGSQPSPNQQVSSVDRIDYSNDTITTSPRGSLSVARERFSATCNNSYGYFGGGGVPTISTIDRIDFSNDTITASIRSYFSANKDTTSASSAAANGLPQ